MQKEFVFNKLFVWSRQEKYIELHDAIFKMFHAHRILYSLAFSEIMKTTKATTMAETVDWILSSLS